MRWLTGSLRRRVAVTFALGGLLLCAAFAATAYSVTREDLIEQQERAALRRAYQDARLLRDQLATTGTAPAEALAALPLGGATAVVVHHRGRWYSSSLDVDSSAVPEALRRTTGPGAGAGQVAHLTTRAAGQPRLVVGVPVVAADAVLYEVVPLTELGSGLRTLASVLAVGTLAATGLAALFGAHLARQVLRPLRPLSSTAGAIAAGDLARRLPSTRDPDLALMVGSFNSMVDGLQQRIERDARFAGDVSHELRSPLTTLTTSAQLLDARRSELSPRSQQVLDLLLQDLGRLQRLLEDLLELARRDAGTPLQTVPVELDVLVAHVLRTSGRPAGLLSAEPCGEGGLTVLGDKLRLERAVSNLLDNADRHGGGVRGVQVRREGDGVALAVDDAGPGVATEHRERVFERFATASGARGSSPGTGLGLALVRETALAHGGSVSCGGAPQGGARFVLVLPAAPAPAVEGTAAEPTPAGAGSPSPAATRPGSRLPAAR